MHSVNILLTELLRYCFFYPFSSTATMFPVSVILKVLGLFNPDSAKGELLIPQETSVLQRAKGKHLTIQPRSPQGFQHDALAYLFTSIKNTEFLHQY